MTVLGEQPKGNIWILNKECYLDEDGSILDPSDSPFYWLSDHVSNPAIVPAGSSLVVKLMFLSGPYFLWCNKRYQLFVLAGSKCDVVSLPYDTRNKQMGHCHRTVQSLNCSVTVAHGQDGKGKTTALLSELSLFGGQKKPFYSRGTKESFVSILARQTVPIGLDDPQSLKNISELLINWPLRRCKNHKHKKRCQ